MSEAWNGSSPLEESEKTEPRGDSRRDSSVWQQVVPAGAAGSIFGRTADAQGPLRYKEPDQVRQPGAVGDEIRSASVCRLAGDFWTQTSLSRRTAHLERL